jgi:hypothetical protein
MRTIANRQINQPRLREALNLAQPDMLALKASDLLVMNIDPLAAAQTVCAALPKIEHLRDQMTHELRNFEISCLDKAQVYALALIQAHSICLSIDAKSLELRNLIPEASSLRARLLSDLEALIKRGHVSTSRLTSLKGANGYCNIASDLLVIAAVLRDTWGGVSDKTAVTEGDLVRAESMGERILRILGQRDERTELAATASLERQQVYTLLMRSYGELRRAVTYLRWHEGDADRFAPSVYRKSIPGRKKRSAAAEQSPGTQQFPAPPATVTICGNQSVAVSDVKTANDEPEKNGKPGSDPFIN